MQSEELLKTLDSLDYFEGFPGLMRFRAHSPE